MKSSFKVFKFTDYVSNVTVIRVAIFFKCSHYVKVFTYDYRNDDPVAIELLDLYNTYIANKEYSKKNKKEEFFDNGK